MPTQRTRQAIGGTRTSGLARLVGLFVLLAIDAVLLPIAVGAAAVYMVVDVAFSLVLDRRASGNGLIMGMLKGIFMWAIDLHKWVLVGREFPGFIPSRA